MPKRIALAISVAALFAATACQSNPPNAVEADPEYPTFKVQTVSLSFDTPSAGWSLEPVSAHRVQDEHWVIFELSPPEGMAAQVISEVSATAEFAGADLPIRSFVLGKTWNWDSETDATFIESIDEIQETLDEGERRPLIEN